MEPDSELVSFALTNRGRPLCYRRRSIGPHLPDAKYEVYGERTHNGMTQILTFFLDSVVWINICEQTNPRIVQN